MEALDISIENDVIEFRYFHIFHSVVYDIRICIHIRVDCCHKALHFHLLVFLLDKGVSFSAIYKP